MFESHPPEIRDFLSATSVLERLSAPMCDALRERDDSAALLDRVRRAGLFLNGLDARGEWFARQGDPTLAIRHAVAAEDTEMASGLVRGHVGSALSAGAFAQLLAWLDQLGEATILRHPDLAAYKAWRLHMRGRMVEAERCTDLDGPVDAETPGAVLTFRAFLALSRGKIMNAPENCRIRWHRTCWIQALYRPTPKA